MKHDLDRPSRWVFRMGQHWMEVRLDATRITLAYHPLIRREDGRIEVVDMDGAVMDSFSAGSAVPGVDPITLADFESEDAAERAPWVATHLRLGILTMEDLEDLGSVRLQPVEGGLYATPEGVRGVFLSDDAGAYLECRDGDVEILPHEFHLLQPVGPEANFVDAEAAR